MPSGDVHLPHHERRGDWLKRVQEEEEMKVEGLDTEMRNEAD
jgi:hypothetical protein